MNCKKRILFLTGKLSAGGAERQMTTIACLLKDREYNIEFYCFRESDDSFSSEII